METLKPADSFKLTEVFSKGNSKLGRQVLTFSLPAIHTCPGSSELCRSLCYADRKQSRFSTPTVQNAYKRNLELSRRDDFHLIVSAVLGSRRLHAPLVRLHVSGDFYDRVYTRKWLLAVKANPHARFWCYTRSWRVQSIRPLLESMGGLPNMQLWYSWDDETGEPANVPPRVRTAYMQVEEGHLPAGAADLVFREHQLRGTVAKRVGSTLVCPAENGVSSTVHCDRCRVCFTDPETDPARRTRGRFSLALV